MTKSYRFFDIILGVFVAVLIISNIASSAKIVDWGFSILGIRLAFDAGTMVVANIGVGAGPVALGQFIASGATAADIPTLSALALAVLAAVAGMVGLLSLRRRR